MNISSRHAENAAAMRFLDGGQCHSDIAELLYIPARRLAGVDVITAHGRKPFPAIGLAHEGNYFAVATGMQHVTLRLPTDHAELLVSNGAFANEAFGTSNWISFAPFSLRIDMDVWIEVAFENSSL
jgi:hypothetical protein